MRALLLALLVPLWGATGDSWARLRPPSPLKTRLAQIPRAAAKAHFANQAYTAPKLGLPASGGVFVTLADHRGEHPTTRACWGNLRPAGNDLGEVVAETAQAALSQDWRQKAVRTEELAHLQFVISLVGPLEAVAPGATLRPKSEGLYLTDGRRGAVLLPGEALTAAWQEATCRRKAGIPPRVPVYRYRFHTLMIEEQPR